MNDVDGDFFEMMVPMLWAQGHVEFSVSNFDANYPTISKSGPVQLNGFRLLQHMTAAYAGSLSSQSLDTIRKQVGVILLTSSFFHGRHKNRLVSEAGVDLDAGVAAFMEEISFGHARWCFFQKLLRKASRQSSATNRAEIPQERA